MKAKYIAKNLKLIERNKEWVSSPLSAARKLHYYPAILLSYIALLTQKRKSINYLGTEFKFDNPATPLNLQNYPYEVGVKLLSHIHDKPESILDIGANIGQFSRTIAFLLPGSKIDSFEPNPNVFSILSSNATGQITPYNYALGAEKAEATFYFEPNRSGIGSFLKENAGETGRVKEIRVKVENDVAAVTGRNAYDLVKIDVEGFEYEVIQALKNVKTKFLYIEVSGDGRDRHYTDRKLYSEIGRILGDFNVIYSSGFTEGNPTYELLLKFV